MSDLPAELASWWQPVEYAVQGVLLGFRPGVHTGVRIGAGGRFEGYKTLLQRPEVRRIDPVATRRAGSKVPLVRTYRTKVGATVVLWVDGSASMAFGEKVREAAKIVLCLGYSASLFGDRFAVVGYADEAETITQGTPAMAAALEAARKLWQHTPRGRNSGVLQACRQLPPRRAMVVWISDFHLEEGILERALAHLGHHDTLLLSLLHPAEFQPRVRWGWSCLADPETGEVRGVWVRPGLIRQLERQLPLRRERLQAAARRYGASFLELAHADPVELARFFLERRDRLCVCG